MAQVESYRSTEQDRKPRSKPTHLGSINLQQEAKENPMNSMKRQKDRTLKEELPSSGGAQCTPGDQWRTNSRKNEKTEPKQKQHPVVDVTGDGSKL